MVGRVGFPAVTTPRGAQRDTQSAVNQIRERLEALEAELSNVAKTGAAGLQQLQATIGVAVSTGGGTGGGTGGAGGTGTMPIYNSVGTIAGGLAVGLVGSNAIGVVDPTVLSQSFGCIGISQGSTPAGIAVATVGMVASVGGSFTAFAPVFAGVGGLLTQTPPTAPCVIQVGVALPGGLVLVAPAPTLLHATSLFATSMDDLLPITRDPGETIQFNDVTVGTRRILDFVAGPGVTMSVTDDPANNRVVVNIGVPPDVDDFAPFIQRGWEVIDEDSEDGTDTILASSSGPVG